MNKRHDRRTQATTDWRLARIAAAMGRALLFLLIVGVGIVAPLDRIAIHPELPPWAGGRRTWLGDALVASRGYRVAYCGLGILFASILLLAIFGKPTKARC